MDNHIAPEKTAALDKLDRMKDSVIVAGRSAADQDREAHALIKALRCENNGILKLNAELRNNIRSADKISEVSTISMIIALIAAAICLAGWMLS